MLRCLNLALLCGLFLVAGTGRADEGYFDSGGVQIHYLVEGTGEPVVLIHGFVVDAYIQWALPGVMRLLAKDHLVIALDVRGHGKSGKPIEAEKYGTEMVEDVVRLLDHLELKKAHVVGYSMGALITGKLLATHPDRLLSATLGGCGVFPEGARQPPYLEELAQSLEQGKGIGPLMRALSPSGKSSPPATVTTVVNRLVRENGKALAAVVRSWKDLGVSKEKLKANKVPTLAVIGSKDPLKEAIDLMKDEMANLEVIVIDGGNHLSTYTSPKFIHSLRKFLADNSQKKKKGDKKETSKTPEYVEVDYDKIDRRIAKEPKYNASPRYGLFIFDPQGRFRVWAVFDKSKAEAPHYDVLYFDKNGNGDLTEDGERFTGAYDEKTKMLSILVGDLPVPGTKLVHTELKFYTVEVHNYKGFCFLMKWNGTDSVEGGYSPLSDDNTTHNTIYSTSAKLAPVLRPTILGPLDFRATAELLFPIGGMGNLQLILGNPGSGPDTFCAVHESFLIPGNDRIMATLIAHDAEGRETRVQTEIKKHC